MTELIIPSEAPALGELKERRLDQTARKAVLSLLNKLEHGRITIIEDNHRYAFGEEFSTSSLQADITVHHLQFYSRILFGGSIGAAEAYMEGLWSADDLTMVMRILAINQKAFQDMEKGLARLAAPFYKLYHFARKNTKTGSRKNILAHYDLGNDFYSLVLDKSMTYSCGIFEHEQSTLEEAMQAKYDRICRKLKLEPGHRVVEIGTGWGGFALYAAKHYGCRVTTTTISRQQFDYAQQRVREAGLEDRITLLFDDYRELRGSYDKLVSIEMIEAIGHRYFDTYFRKCSELLKPQGMMLLQSITIADQRYREARKSIDFIQRHIFPGGCLPSVAALSDAIARRTDMRIFHLEDIGPHYATTLQRWRERFHAQADKIRRLGYPERFMRSWEYYFCYCEAGFRRQSIGTVQLLLTKPQALRAPLTSSDC